MRKTLVFSADYLRTSRGGEVWLNFICKYNPGEISVLCLDGPISRQGHLIKGSFYLNIFLCWLLNSLPKFLLTRFLRVKSENELRSFILAFTSMLFLFKNKRKYRNVVIMGPKIVWIIVRIVMGKSITYIAVGQSGWIDYYSDVADKFVALTPFMASEAKQHMFTVDTIMNGVDIKAFYTDGDTARFSDRVLCVAALSEDKNLITLMDAILLSETLSLDIYGNGRMRAEVMRHPAFEKGKVRLLSSSFSEMPKVYKRYSTFILPSLNEAFGICLLEAYAAGCRIVCHDSENMRSFLPVDTKFCNCADPVQMKEALEFASTAREAILNTDRLSFLSKFDWEKIGMQYSRLFGE